MFLPLEDDSLQNNQGAAQKRKEDMKEKIVNGAQVALARTIVWAIPPLPPLCLYFVQLHGICVHTSMRIATRMIKLMNFKNI